MQSLESKELVTCRYAWRNLYWFVTDAGIEYLREYLNVPAEVVPATLMKSTRCVPLTYCLKLAGLTGSIQAVQASTPSCS